jgi:hypothetical protein
VDRLNRRHLLLGADLLRAMLVALIPLLRIAGILQLWELYALAFSLALLSFASAVATTAVLPALAQSEKTRINAAYSRSQKDWALLLPVFVFPSQVI